jgi:hypothetical protein
MTCRPVSVAAREEAAHVGSSGSIALRAALDAAHEAAQAWAIVFSKSRVVRRDVPLGFEPSEYSDADYDAVADYMAPLESAAAEAPVTPSGLRWCYRGEAVLFEISRLLNAPYDDLVARVDIAAAIRVMSDYIGGSSSVVSRDRRGRVPRQAERNMYQPQPTWLAFSGGAFIDVCKLEVIRYADGWRRIAWRTVHSPNGSAVHDDGTVTFERVGASTTRVTVRGLQEFTLAPYWAALEPWMAPTVKDALVEESYRRFFTATLDNVEACYEGREFRIGRDQDESDDEPLEDRLRRTWSVLRQMLPDRPFDELARRAWARSTPQPDEVDDDGFRHFAGGGTGSATAEGIPAWGNAMLRWQQELAEVLADDVSGRRAGGD